jgi:uncharacterized protein YraI
MTTHTLRTLALLSAIAAGAGCSGQAIDGTGDESDSPDITRASENANVGGQAKVTASALNLRSGPGTTYAILTSMPNGTVVNVLAASNGWYKVDDSGRTGWCSGAFLSPVSGGPTGGTTAVDRAMARADSGLGFSYHWGGGCWDPASSAHGACYGSCPSCTHSGSWGADCSGYVAKVWQVPGAEATTTCDHPYSTYNFNNTHDHWTDVSRANVQRGDAFVYNSGGEGHIFLYDHGDAWGWVTAYEAKGCSYGIVKDSRTASSQYKAIHREGF